MSQVIIGCDPGASGALAVLIDGELTDVDDMPFMMLKVNKTKRKRVDLDGVFLLMKQYQALYIRPGDEVRFIIEDVGPTPRDSAQSAFHFGRAATIPEVCAAGMGWARSRVTPATWKRQLKLRKEKDEARKRAMELFPDFTHRFRLAKHDGRAEAALIALWGRNNVGA